MNGCQELIFFIKEYSIRIIDAGSAKIKYRALPGAYTCLIVLISHSQFLFHIIQFVHPDTDSQNFIFSNDIFYLKIPGFPGIE